GTSALISTRIAARSNSFPSSAGPCRSSYSEAGGSIRVHTVGGALIGKDRPFAAPADRNFVAMIVDDGQVQRGRLDAIRAMFVEAAGELEQSLPHIGHGERRIVPAADAYPQFFGYKFPTLHPSIVSPMKAA